ncbi:hypothetical protein MMC10_010546 [Thelotrema lepadinum]|nr:hypothetical protein [Thelotrema lepadinum]
MGSLPSPPVALEGHCSTIYNNSLYTYQWNAFQTLPLQEGAQWSQLPMGVAVNGSKCVMGQWDGQDALIVVGGITSNASDAQYPGLQHFNFANKTWASTPPGASVTQNRQMHGATYLNDTQSVLVYSGFQDDSFTNSSETFTISTTEPYTMKSFVAQSPPGISPVVLPWNSSHAVMVGGSPENKNVWVFSEATGWQQIQIALPNSVGNMSMVQGSIIQGDNNAKALQLFNMTTTPNQVTSLLVQSSDSQPASKEIDRGKVIIKDGKRLSSRQVDLSTWPPYNGTQAPSVARNGFALSQSGSGLVVISGGATNAGDSVCMFNQTGNNWINAEQFFTGQQETPSSAVSSSAVSSVSFPTATSSSAAATSSPATSSDGGLSDTSRIILGSVLGGLAGLAAILILLLLLLRCRKQRKQRNRDYSENKRPMGFEDRTAATGLDKRSLSNSSRNSSRGGFFQRNFSPENALERPQISNPQLVSDSTAADKDLMHARTIETGPVVGTPRGEARDAGWSQYFANSNSNTALNNVNGQEPVLVNTASRQTAYSTSDYNRISHTASIHPFEEGLEPVTTRSSGYPQSEESWEKSKFHPQSTISTAAYRPGTAISHVSEEAPESFLDPASSSSGTQAWDPVGGGDGRSGYDRRPSSSVYADSINFPHPGDKVYIPGVSDVHASAQKPNNLWRQPSDSRGMRTMATKDFGVASKPSTADQTVTPSLASVTTSSTGGQRPPIQSDMSWLNLGHQ